MKRLVLLIFLLGSFTALAEEEHKTEPCTSCHTFEKVEFPLERDNQEALNLPVYILKLTGTKETGN